MLGERIRAERRKQHKTQEQLAEHLGVQRSVISKYETGAIAPSVAQLKKIAEFLGIPLIELIKENDPEALFVVDIGNYTCRMIKPEERERMDDSEKKYYDFRLLADCYPERLDKMLTDSYQKLNKLGKIEAVKRTKELLNTKEYTEEDTKPPFVAHLVEHTGSNDDTNK